MDNEYYIQEYIQTRGLSKSTEYSLRTCLKNYCKFQQANLQQLLDEADFEEEQRIRWKKRKLRVRLTNYMNYVKSTMNYNSAKHHLKIVKAFYRHNYIEIGKLPPLNNINANINKPIQYKDLPNKEVIKLAYDIAEPLMKTLLLFLSSTGMSKVDALNLQVQDFINSTSSYHDTDNLMEVLQLLQGQEVIPTWKCRRQKTSKYFITFNTAEATQEIINYLKFRLERNPVQVTDKLFKISSHHYTRKFEELNDALNLGKVGSYNRLRGHMLRKFHASNLEKFGMDRYKINVLQGKSNNAVDDVYFFEDEDILRQEYIKAMGGLIILSPVNKVDVYSDEYVKLQDENKKLQVKFDKLKKDVQEIKSWYVFD